MSIAKRRVRAPKKMSPSQERRYLRIVILLVFISLLWIFFAPGSGLLTYFTKKAELKKLENQTALISDTNDSMRKDIHRLQNDPAFLEEVARRDFNMQGENEIIFDFSKKSNKENQ